MTPASSGEEVVVMSHSHSRSHRLALMAVLAVALLGLSGCYEDPGEVTMYDPGVYKGEEDPLLARSGTDELEAKLQNRFQAGQTDR
jgi:hypothetical protein